MGLSNYAHFLCIYEQADTARVSSMLLHCIAFHVCTLSACVCRNMDIWSLRALVMRCDTPRSMAITKHIIKQNKCPISPCSEYE
jgi:hypothetical protein